MLKLKRSFLLLLVLFLAACGTQTQLPEAPQITDDGLGQISATELEAAFSATGVSAQSSWNKVKYNKFTLKKVVENKKDDKQVYKLAIICKVPNKKNVLAVVGAAHLKDGQYKYFLVPKKYVKCAAFEFEYFGDEVKFKLEQKKNNQYSGVEYEGKLKVWGKKHDYKASKFFHVKHGEAKFIVINKYKKVEEPKKLKLVVKKLFKVGYDGYEVHPKDAYLDLKLICDGGVTVDIGNKTHYEAYLSDLQGKNCELKEKFHDDEYQTVQYSVSYDTDYGKDEVTYNDCYTKKDDYGKEYDSCEYSRYYIDEHAKKLVIIIVDNVKKKEQEKKFELVVKKVFKEEYNGKEVYPEDYKLDIKLVCDGGITVDIGDDTDYESNYYDLRGKNCEVKEKFYDDKYQTVQYSVNYDTDYGEDKLTYNDCYTKKDDYGKDYDSCEYSSYYVDKGAHKLIITIVDRVQPRYYPPHPKS